MPPLFEFEVFRVWRERERGGGAVDSWVREHERESDRDDLS